MTQQHINTARRAGTAVRNQRRGARGGAI